MNRSLAIVLAVIVAFGGGGLWYSNQSPEPGPLLAAANAQDADIDTSGVLEMSIGNPDAKVTVIEYASFTCPHCKNFHANVLGELEKNYIDTGKINFVFREVYFDRFGLWAGIVARCGGPERYFGIADLLFEQQKEWSAGGDPAQIAANLRTIGKTAGITDEQLDICMNDRENAQAMVLVYHQNSTVDEVRSTPSFVINGEKYSNMNYADFAAVIEEKLAE